MRKNKTPIPRTIKSIWRTPYVKNINTSEHYPEVFSDKQDEQESYDLLDIRIRDGTLCGDVKKL